jgi:hypothetical protein
VANTRQTHQFRNIHTLLSLVRATSAGRIAVFTKPEDAPRQQAGGLPFSVGGRETKTLAGLPFSVGEHYRIT